MARVDTCQRGSLPGGGGVVLAQAGHDVDQRVDTWKTNGARGQAPPKRGDEEAGNRRSSGPVGSREAVRLTLLPHVHVVHLPVAVLGLADAAVGQRVAGVVGVHSEVEVVAWVSHGELEDREKQRVGVRVQRRVRNLTVQ